MECICEVCLNKNISTCSCKSNKVKYSDGGFFAIKVCSKFIKSILWNWTFNLLLMLRITSYNSGNQRGFRWWRYLKLFWTLLDFVYFENSEFSCHLRTVQLCYYVITDKTISVNSPSIFIRANSRLYREILSPRQTIKSLWKEISDWRSCLAVLIIKNIWLASIKVFPYPVHHDVCGWQISDKIYNLDPASLLNQTEGILSFIPGDALF